MLGSHSFNKCLHVSRKAVARVLQDFRVEAGRIEAGMFDDGGNGAGPGGVREQFPARWRTTSLLPYPDQGPESGADFGAQANDVFDSEGDFEEVIFGFGLWEE